MNVFTDRVRVLHLNAGNLYGGVESILVAIAKLRDRCPTMEPSFALCEEGRLSQELTGAGVPVSTPGALRDRRRGGSVSVAIGSLP